VAHAGVGATSGTGAASMTKREIIDEIMARNPSASPTFLATFSEGELADYLRQLAEVATGVRGSTPSDVPISTPAGLDATDVRGRPDPAR
jgi:hypothetical protein